MTDSVLVVGAGPTGLAAALELSRLGVPVRLIDRLPHPSPTSRALAVHARTLELLDRRGLAAEMVRLGHPVRRVVMHDRSGPLGAVELRGIPSRFGFVLMLAQSDTERLFAERLTKQGVTVERGVELIGALPAGQGVRVQLRRADGRTESVVSRWVIAADGAHSAVRETTGLRFAGRSDPQWYALADVDAEGALPNGQVSVFLGADGLAGLFPMGGNRFRMMAAGGGTGDPDAREMQRRYDRVAPAALPMRMHEPRWSSRFRITSRHLTALRAGGIFFGGDAAHVHSPVGGQGMNTGIQDMINLCWKLALVHRGRAWPALLDTYQVERLPLVRDIVRTTEAATALIAGRHPMVHRALGRALPVALGRPAVQRRAVRTLSQLGADYRSSPLSAPASRAAAPVRPGDRVPDVVIREPYPGRLHDLLDPDRFTLLVLGAGRDLPELATWDSLVTVRTATLGRPGPAALLLVRPDGYLATAAHRDDPHAVTGWLARWFTP